MIFYFTGTGNSQYAAQKLVSDDERLVSVVECLRKDNYTFEIAENESVGLVFPVYFGGLPVAVRQFIERLRLNAVPAYLYGVLTSGGSPAGAGAMLRDRLGEAGLTLDASYSVTMPDNYVMLYTISPESEEKKILARADRDLERICSKIAGRRRTFAARSPIGKAMTAVLYPVYLNGRKTAPFTTNETCIGCAACANRCPSRAIEMKDGHPTWVKERCCFCMSCVRCGAIEYGTKLTGKARYKHPMLRKKAGHGEHGAPGAAAHDHGAAAAGHDHGSSAPAAHDHGAAAGGHDHGGDDCCCPPDEAGGTHVHGSPAPAAHDLGAAAGGHDHSGGDDCCPPDEAGGTHVH